MPPKGHDMYIEVKPATEKQKAYAAKIAKALGKEDILSNFPDTMDEISSFISMFEKQYYATVGNQGTTEEPTEKQVKFAHMICRNLSRSNHPEVDYELISCKTKADYTKFLSKWRPVWEEQL